MTWTLRMFSGAMLALATLATAQSPQASQPQTRPAGEAIPWPMDFAATAPGLMAADDLLHKPAGKFGPVVARDGHFYTGDQRIRFWGVNVCFAACFPTHEQADAIAQRLARFGINAVRFHHMDMMKYPRGIFADDKLETLSPEALDRLDYFVAALKKNGVYSNINLHVSRHYSKAHKWENADKTPSFDKLIDIFHPELIRVNKQYARDLMGHVNQYTGKPYAEESAVCMVEINNEDSLLMWGSDRDLEQLVEPYAGMLQERWNAWLVKKYGTREKLAAAWNKDAQPLGQSVLNDAAFSSYGKPGSAWQLELHEDAAAKVTVAGGEAVVEVSQGTGTAWHVQFKHVGVTLKGGQYYTLTLDAAGQAGATMDVSVGQDGPPYSSLGLVAPAKIQEKATTLRFGFVAAKDENNARVSFSLGKNAGKVTIRNVRLQPGGQEGLLAGEDPAKGSVGRHSRARPATAERVDDWYEFLQQTEEAYFESMRDFLKKDLGVKAPITGTIALGPLGTRSQRNMDFIDAHAYWDHPQFPRKGWDMKDWRINNNAMVDQPGRSNLGGLAAIRVHGKPFTVTEYNHSAPNDYQAECIPMIASFAAAQDWDGVFLFAYSHNADFQKQKMDSFFDIEGNALKMPLMPAGARLFLGGAVPALKERRVVAIDHAKAVRHTPRFLFLMRDFLADQYAVTPGEYYAYQMAVTYDGKAREPGAKEAWISHTAAPANAGKGSGQYSVVTDKALVFVGRVAAGEKVMLGGAQLTADADAGFFTLMLVPADPAHTLATADRLLLTVAGTGENVGMGWDAARRTVSDRLGKGPMHVDPVPVTLQWPGGRPLTVHALKPDGTRGAAVGVKRETDRQSIPLGKAPSLWYVLERPR